MGNKWIRTKIQGHTQGVIRSHLMRPGSDLFLNKKKNFRTVSTAAYTTIRHV
jgi:hypothetical protein